MKKADIGLIGLAVMGENLAMNMESKGFTVAVYNRTTSKVDNFVNGRGARSRVLPAGLAAGAVFLVLLLLFGALFFPQLHLGRGLLPIGAAVLAGAGLGAVLSAMGRR